MLLYEKAGNIGILTINRPEALNALNSALLDCLYEKVTEIAHDTELRCLIVTGAGKAFVAGRPKLCGIEFVERYLRYIDAENAFLLLFPSDKCDGLLRELAKDYADSPVNLFEPILLCALALAHFGREPQRLDLSAKEAESFQQAHSFRHRQANHRTQYRLCPLRNARFP